MFCKSNAQCPITELVFASDLETMANLINDNAGCFKEKLKEPGFERYKAIVDNLYNFSYPWVYHTIPGKERLFENFYSQWGSTWPTLLSPKPVKSCSADFYAAIDQMVASDPFFFSKKDAQGIPFKYIDWLRVRDLKQKYGTQSVVNLMAATRKIANL